MKRTLAALFLLCAALLTACASTEQPAATEAMQLANPWVEYETLEEAEAAAGVDFSFPETVGGCFSARSYRVMAECLMEVTYRDKDDEAFEVTVRQSAGEGQDISGDYRSYETVTEFTEGDSTVVHKSGEYGELTLIWYDGYSYSLYAPNGYWGDSYNDFHRCLFPI